MKKIILLFFTVFTLVSQAQQVDDSVSIEPLYTSQSFYSLDNGEVAKYSNENWDIAFSVSGHGAAGSAILLNEATTQLWATPFDTSGWDNFDTTDYVSWDEQFNSDTSWTNGAFNSYRGASGFFDLGWGLLNPSNNYWTFGDSLYLVKLNDGTYRKLWVESLKTGVWSFRYATLDGALDKTVSITKADYTNKNFIYFSLEDEKLLDREPANDSWDFTFAKHRDEVMPGIVVSVTSVFSNRNVWSAKANESDLTDALNSSAPDTDFNQNTINIGREWKKYSSSTGWNVYDSIAYFVYDEDSSDFYRLVFTDFGGMGTGKFYFTKELLGQVSVDEYGDSDVAISLYPNPARDQFTILGTLPPGEVVIGLYDITGSLVREKIYSVNYQVSKIGFDVSDLPSGLYILNIEGAQYRATKKIIINGR